MGLLKKSRSAILISYITLIFGLLVIPSLAQVGSDVKVSVDITQLKLSDSKNLSPWLNALIAVTGAFFIPTQLNNKPQFEIVEEGDLKIIKGDCRALFDAFQTLLFYEYQITDVTIIGKSFPCKYGSHAAAVMRYPNDGTVVVIERCLGDGNDLLIKAFKDINAFWELYGKEDLTIIGGKKDLLSK